MNQLNTIKFGNTHRDFVAILNKRVNEYFRDNNLSRHGNTEMVLKTIFMFVLYLFPYMLIITGAISQMIYIIPAVIIMSLGVAGIGLSVMHDANHGAYSKHKWVNTALGYSLNFVGANAFTWKIQHNVLHHSFTNVHEEDEDISPRGILRLTPHSEWKGIHRYQHYYAWFIYGLMTIVWLFFKDFVRVIKYHKSGMAKKQKANIVFESFVLISSKLVYIGYLFVLPVVLTPLLWWQVLLGIVIMHYVAGFILAIIFQPAHVIEGTEFPLPDENSQLENNWAVHQLLTTTNFANRSRWFSWYIGGLNFQIEHHLFPNVCHVHYRKISGIVRDTAREYGLPYKSAITFFDAVRGHARLLRQLGMKPMHVNLS